MEIIQPNLLKRWLIIFTALLAVKWVMPSAGIIVCIGLAFYALRGPKQSVEAIAVLSFLLLLGGIDTSLGRWPVLFAAAGRTLWDGVFLGKPTPPVTIPLLLFGVTIFLFSLLSSTFPLVSVLKLVTFVLGAGTALIGFYRTVHLRQYWLSWFYTLGVFVLVASIPLYFLPAGYSRNGVGFQGVLTHPQTFGPVLAPLTALFTGLYLFQPGFRSVGTGVLAGLGWVGMYASLSRTSLLATVLALGLAVAIGFLFKSESWGRAISRAIGRPEVILAGLLAFGVVGSQWSDIQEEVSGFLFKDDGASSATNILEESRGSRMNASMANFWSQPITGIGFGVPSNPMRFARQLERGPMGIPVSASVEKGFMPTAVLEETGIVGAILVLLLLGYLFTPAIRRGTPTIFWMLASALLINFGEMVFFSVGGMGFYFWVVMAFCYNWAISTPAPQQQGHPIPRGRPTRPVAPAQRSSVQRPV